MCAIPQMRTSGCCFPTLLFICICLWPKDSLSQSGVIFVPLSLGIFAISRQISGCQILEEYCCWHLMKVNGDLNMPCCIQDRSLYQRMIQPNCLRTPCVPRPEPLVHLSDHSWPPWQFYGLMVTPLFHRRTKNSTWQLHLAHVYIPDKWQSWRERGPWSSHIPYPMLVSKTSEMSFYNWMTRA